MRAWMFFLILGAVVLVAQPSTFDGGVLDGMENPGIIGAGIFFIVAILFFRPEERLITQAGDRLHTGLSGCFGLILTILFWLTIGSFALFALGVVTP